MKKLLVVLVLAGPLSLGVAFAEPFRAATIAEETLGVACQSSGAMAVGNVRFAFDPATNEPGSIEYDGLFDDFERFAETTRRVRLLKVEDTGRGSYLFEGIDDTIGGGEVRGHYKSAEDFEVNAYYAKQHRPMETCVFYRLSPLKNRWAKKIVKKNEPRFPRKQR